MARLIRRRRDGSFVLRLPERTVELLGTLADQLDPLLDDQSADTGLRRLFPPAHTDDVLAEAEWQIEQGAALLDSRRAALTALRHPADEPMDEDQLVSWMQGVNSLRLVLGERLGLSADSDEEAEIEAIEAALVGGTNEEETERLRQHLVTWEVYDLLTALVAHAVRALEGAEP